jgi:hypothetical protein
LSASATSDLLAGNPGQRHVALPMPFKSLGTICP